MCKDFEISEVADRNKAPGPNSIRNEQGEAVFLIPHWTALFNGCLRNDNVPPRWRDCNMSLIFKGKGQLREPASWRGFGKKSCIYKMMASLLLQRLIPLLEFKSVLPDEQYGFRR